MELTKDELSVLRYLNQHPDSTIEKSCSALGIDLLYVDAIDTALLSQGLVKVSLLRYRKVQEGYCQLRHYQVTDTGQRITRIAV